MKLKNFRIPNWTAGEMTPAHGQMVLQYMKERAAANRTADAPTVVAYTHGVTCVANAYAGGVIAPNGRIYMIPNGQATATTWHYIDTDGSVIAYTHGATCVSGAYFGGVLTKNGRIYMIPNAQSTVTTWHYIDTLTGAVVAYTHGATCVSGAYVGGCLSPNGKIYMAPYQQGTATEWHYIDTLTGAVVAYTHGTNAVFRAAWGSSITADGRIFFNPESMYNQTISYYIDTDDIVKSFTHGATTQWRGSALGYNGNIYVSRDAKYYNPYTNVNGNYTASGSGDTIGAVNGFDGRIYFVPSGNATATVWGYIDIATNTVLAYSHGSTAVGNAYRGGVLAPNGRIYLIPFTQATATVWHYIQTNNTYPLSKNVLNSPYFNKF